MAGGENDLGQLIIGINGGGQDLIGGVCGKRQAAFVVGLVQNQTQCINIQLIVQLGEAIGHFRGGVAAAVFFRQGSVFQRPKSGKANIADAEDILVVFENIVGLQIDIHKSGPAAGIQRGAQIQGQMQRLSMGQLRIFQQGFRAITVSREDKDLVTVLGFLAADLLAAHEAFQQGKGIEGFGFGNHFLGKGLEIRLGFFPVLEGTGQQHGLYLGARCRNGNDFDDIFFPGFLADGRETMDTVVLSKALTGNEPVHNGAIGFQFRQIIASYHFSNYIIMDKNRKSNIKPLNFSLCADKTRRDLPGGNV